MDSAIQRQYLVTLRELTQLTQKNFAFELGITRPYYGILERCETRLDEKTLNEIIKNFRVKRERAYCFVLRGKNSFAAFAICGDVNVLHRNLTWKQAIELTSLWAIGLCLASPVDKSKFCVHYGFPEIR